MRLDTDVSFSKKIPEIVLRTPVQEDVARPDHLSVQITNISFLQAEAFNTRPIFIRVWWG